MYHPTMVRIVDEVAREMAGEGIEVYLDGKYRLGQATTPEGANAAVLGILGRATASRWDSTTHDGRPDHA